ncbi:hypothetical protein NUW58_g2438 [Xylaria curta]|uniref:Uncharacterized protein n=1 Tax=Xylaria curta TaxID=42375 RepID=A0ACC1PGY0_9PEZI|nr:hypothetical protein NUW58_g2438 [Xylaria curta]
MVSVAVEPPAQAQRRTVLYPPLVVSCQSNQYSFLQVVLIDAGGAVVESESLLQGTISASPQLLENAVGSSRTPKEYAVFPDLVIDRSGTYTLQVNGYQIDYDSVPPTTYHAGAVATRSIRVRSSSVATERPSNSETRLLDRLTQAGFPMPWAQE